MKRFYLMAIMLVALAMPAVMPQNANAQLNNVFGNNASSTPSQPGSDSSAPDLSKLLTEAKANFQLEGEGTYLVTSEMDGVKLPVYVYMNQAKTLIWVKVNLMKLSNDATQHTDKLLQLLELSGTFGEAFYSYNSSSTYLELYSVFRPESINAKDLASRIQTMTTQVLKQREAWYADEWTVARHVGSWSAGMGENASMTIDLRVDGSFSLVNNANGQSTSIKGSYQIEQGKLTMKDTDGNQIAGEINFVDGNHFSLNVNNQNLSFERS